MDNDVADQVAFNAAREAVEALGPSAKRLLAVLDVVRAGKIDYTKFNDLLRAAEMEESQRRADERSTRSDASHATAIAKDRDLVEARFVAEAEAVSGRVRVEISGFIAALMMGNYTRDMTYSLPIIAGEAVNLADEVIARCSETKKP